MELKAERDTLREMIDTLSTVLVYEGAVKFTYNKLVYHIFESTATDGFVVNLYSNNTKDSDGYYLDNNLVDGGICTGEAADAIEFMM